MDSIICVICAFFKTSIHAAPKVFIPMKKCFITNMITDQYFCMVAWRTFNLNHLKRLTRPFFEYMRLSYFVIDNLLLHWNCLFFWCLSETSNYNFIFDSVNKEKTGRIIAIEKHSWVPLLAWLNGQGYCSFLCMSCGPWAKEHQHNYCTFQPDLSIVALIMPSSSSI